MNAPDARSPAPRRSGRATSVASALAACTLLAALPAVAAPKAPAAGTAPAAGVRFLDLPLDAAIAQARREGKRVFVDFDASWCPTCRQLEREVLATAEGAALLSGLLAVRVDFDDPRNRPAIERYVILGLPTVAVLDGEGRQVVRVTGYDDKASWTTPLRAALTASDPLPALEQALASRPADADARLALGKALLVHGGGDKARTARALALLEPLLWAAVAADEASRAAAEERAAEVLWTLGRYHQRVVGDAATAQHHWRELAGRFADSSWAAGAWSWYAKAQVELGRPAAGAAALEAAARKQPGAAALSAWLSFARKHGLVDQRAALAAAIDRQAAAPALQALREELAAWR